MKYSFRGVWGPLNAAFLLFLILLSFLKGGDETKPTIPNEPVNSVPEVLEVPTFWGDTMLFSLLPNNLAWAEREVPLDSIHVSRRFSGVWRRFVRSRAELQGWLHRFTEDEYFYKFYYIAQELKVRSLPMDFVYLWIHESGLQDTVRSWAEAVGICQFIKSTAIERGLDVGSFYDERLSPEPALRKCMDFIGEMLAKYNDPTLAAAAYNMGPDGLDRAIEEQGTSNYFELQLSEQTMSFVPWIVVKKEVMANPGRYGLSFLGFNERAFNLHYVEDTLNLAKNVRVLEIARDSLQISVPAFLDANKHFRKKKVDPNGRIRYVPLDNTRDLIYKGKRIVRIPVNLPPPQIDSQILDSLRLRFLLPSIR